MSHILPRCYRNMPDYRLRDTLAEARRFATRLAGLSRRPALIYHVANAAAYVVAPIDGDCWYYNWRLVEEVRP